MKNKAFVQRVADTIQKNADKQGWVCLDHTGLLTQLFGRDCDKKHVDNLRRFIQNHSLQFEYKEEVSPHGGSLSYARNRHDISSDAGPPRCGGRVERCRRYWSSLCTRLRRRFSSSLLDTEKLLAEEEAPTPWWAREAAQKRLSRSSRRKTKKASHKPSLPFRDS